MSVEWSPSERLIAGARVHAALSDPQRLAMVEELHAGDRSPMWFSREWGLPSNLLAHHVKVLVEAGLVLRRPSEADGRRVYLRLTPGGRSAADPDPVRARAVVFVCTHNSARSQFAEAMWRERSTVRVTSGGTEPAGRIHPLARRVARQHGIDFGSAKPKPLIDEDMGGALVVTVCDSADERTTVPHTHWSVPDPVVRGTRAAFGAAWDDIADRVAVLAERISPWEQPCP